MYNKNMSAAAIFSPRTDQYIFVLLPLLLCFCLLLNKTIAEPLAFALIIIDQTHVYFTYIQNNFSATLKRSPRFKFIIFICALTSIFTYILYLNFSLLGIYVTVKYFTIFHFCRQQYGWLKIINSKLGLPKKIKLISEVSLHIYCLVPILIGHSQKFFFSWFSKVPNIFSIPDFAVESIFAVYICCAILYFLYEAYLHISNRKFFNITRFGIIAFTFFSWNYAVFYGDPSNYTSVFLLAGHHIISYIFLLYYFNVQKFKQRVSVFLRNSLLVIILFLLILALRNSIPGFDAISLKILRFNLTESQKNIFYYAIPFLWFLTLFHFILDGFIWRKQL